MQFIKVRNLDLKSRKSNSTSTNAPNLLLPTDPAVMAVRWHLPHWVTTPPLPLNTPTTPPPPKKKTKKKTCRCQCCTDIYVVCYQHHSSSHHHCCLHYSPLGPSKAPSIHNQTPLPPQCHLTTAVLGTFSTTRIIRSMPLLTALLPLPNNYFYRKHHQHCHHHQIMSHNATMLIKTTLHCYPATTAASNVVATALSYLQVYKMVSTACFVIPHHDHHLLGVVVVAYNGFSLILTRHDFFLANVTLTCNSLGANYLVHLVFALFLTVLA